jgi:hypothetical protein
VTTILRPFAGSGADANLNPDSENAATATADWVTIALRLMSISFAGISAKMGGRKVLGQD